MQTAPAKWSITTSLTTDDLVVTILYVVNKVIHRGLINALMINEDEDQHKYKVSIIKIRKSFVVLVIILHASTYYKPRRTILGVNSCVQLLKGTALINKVKGH